MVGSVYVGMHKYKVERVFRVIDRKERGNIFVLRYQSKGKWYEFPHHATDCGLAEYEGGKWHVR